MRKEKHKYTEGQKLLIEHSTDRYVVIDTTYPDSGGEPLYGVSVWHEGIHHAKIASATHALIQHLVAAYPIPPGFYVWKGDKFIRR